MSTFPDRHTARALLFDPADRLLLIQYEAARDLAGRKPGDRLFWYTPGGGIDPGETAEQACARELMEEVGLRDAVIGPLVALWDEPISLFRIPPSPMHSSSLSARRMTASTRPICRRPRTIRSLCALAQPCRAGGNRGRDRAARHRSPRAGDSWWKAAGSACQTRPCGLKRAGDAAMSPDVRPRSPDRKRC